MSASKRFKKLTREQQRDDMLARIDEQEKRAAILEGEAYAAGDEQTAWMAKETRASLEKIRANIENQ